MYQKFLLMLEIKREKFMHYWERIFQKCFRALLHVIRARSNRADLRFLHKGVFRERGRGGKPAFPSLSSIWEKQGIRKGRESLTPESSLNLSPWALSPRELKRLALETLESHQGGPGSLGLVGRLFRENVSLWLRALSDWDSGVWRTCFSAPGSP